MSQSITAVVDANKGLFCLLSSSHQWLYAQLMDARVRVLRQTGTHSQKQREQSFQFAQAWLCSSIQNQRWAFHI